LTKAREVSVGRYELIVDLQPSSLAQPFVESAVKRAGTLTFGQGAPLVEERPELQIGAGAPLTA
jgi:hypothetical protein